MAKFFEKEHKHVMRGIAELTAERLTVQNWTDWFKPITFEQSVGFGYRSFPAYDMTRDGFALLAMGFTGPKKLRFKIAYTEVDNQLSSMQF